MNAEEFRRMGPAALQEEIARHKKELMEVRCQIALGEEIHAHQVKNLRKDIARMNTVLREKELAATAADGEETN